MIVSMWMTRDLVTIGPDTSIVEAARLMAQHNIRRLPVVQAQNRRHLLGLVSKHDVLHAFPPNVNPMAPDVDARTSLLKARDIMTTRLVTTTADTPIEHVARLLRERKIGALPVVCDQELLGLITESDIFRAFVSMLGAEQGGLRITFDTTDDGEDPIALVCDLARRHTLKVSSLMSVVYLERSLMVVRLTGGAPEPFVDALWKSGHKVLNVLKLDT